MISRRVILTSIGTDGDILPYAALGQRLLARGHHPILVASEHYRPLAQSSGLDFHPLHTTAENEQLLNDPDFWHPLKCALVGAKWGIAKLQRHYDLLAELSDGGRATFVASPGLLAARLVQEKLGAPLASVVLQPWMIASSSEPPIMPAGLTLPRWAPPPVKWLYWRSMDLVLHLIIGGPLNAMRQRLALPRMTRLFKWWLSPQLIIAFFPEWYAQPQPDWPGQLRTVGFSLDHSGPITDDLTSFLNAGPPPVAVTFGTGMKHAARLFAACVEACRLSNRRAILITRYSDQLPRDLPSTIRHVAFAPFGSLLPHCSAVIHHGGIGTAATALSTRTPQLILPIAYDQTDNSVRIKRLGAGEFIPSRRATPARIAAKLDDVACVAVPPLSFPDALEHAADCVDQLPASGRPRSLLQ